MAKTIKSAADKERDRCLKEYGALDAIARSYDQIDLTRTSLRLVVRRGEETFETVITHPDEDIYATARTILHSPMDEWKFGLYDDKRPLADLMTDLVENVMSQSITQRTSSRDRREQEAERTRVKAEKLAAKTIKNAKKA